jgi:PEP-CTERM/exosortase A-associated glycosyltransferase
MRVLHVFDHSLPLHSGYAFRSAAILREQRRLGWETLQVTGPKQDCPLPEEAADGFRFLRTAHTWPALGRVPVVNQLDVVAALRRRLEGIVRDWRPQVIHAHSPCLNGLAAASVAGRHALPLVYELRASWEDAAVSHGTTTEGSLRYRLSRALETRVVRGADAVTTICEGLRHDILARGVDAARVTVIPNAVDLGQFGVDVAADPALKARFCAPDTRILGFFGSFYAYEGLDVLIRALPDLLGRGARVHLLLVGGGPEDGRLRALSRELGMERHLSFVGRVPQREIPAYYAIADGLVYPRRGNRLTELVTPLKPLEAMAQGKIVMASSVGGHRELIRDRETGFLFVPDDALALADCAERVLASTELDAVRARARRFVQEERTWRRVVAGYAPVYERLVRGKLSDAA